MKDILPPKVLRTAGVVAPDSKVKRFTLSTQSTGNSEIIFDYDRCEGGLPFFEIEDVQGESRVEMKVTYSETIRGIGSEGGRLYRYMFTSIPQESN